MKKVCEDHEPVIITRQKEGSVIMLSLEDFTSLEETAYLLRVPKNAKRLLESIAELERGGGKARKLAE
jgi:antitoxin YefM